MSDSASDTAPDTALEALRALDRESRLLEHSAAILSWDQETYMPDRAVEERSEQLALLQSLAHGRNTDPRVGELLDQLEERETDFLTTAFLAEKRRQYEKAIRIPDRLVRELTQTASRGQNAWIAAREADDFEQFKPWLTRLIALNREIADHLGYDDVRYDALLDQYEPFVSTAEVSGVFAQLKEGLVPLVRKIQAATPVDNAVLRRRYDIDRQQQFSEDLMKALGYDTDRGRLDRSAHPFTTTLGAHDVRITTRFNEYAPESGIFSTIHETGHALYELGAGAELGCSLLAEGTSLGIHESQSRLWENMIGRSRPFWSCRFPELKKLFPEALAGVGLEQFYRAINRVEPSLIRVEADEVTYSLHIILRFELEQALISGDLAVEDLPAAWNDGMEQLLGIRPSRNADGVLQDVHWSMGAFGYFPTYALGNLYAAQFMQVMERDIPGMWDGVERGQTQPVLHWLRTAIHRWGKARGAAELVQEITGGPLDPTVFLEYLRIKYEDIYRG